MAFDGIMIAAIVNELSTNILGGRIDKVSQPEPDEIILSIRNKGAGYRLLLTANASFPRLHLTGVSKENPLTAPMFCMLLRKHIQGGRIVSIEQPDFERIVHFHIEGFNEMGDIVKKMLIIEIMGKYSNIILVEDGVVLDCAKHVSYAQSSVRQILPGRPYHAAPSQNKQNPLTLNREGFLACWEDNAQAVQKLLYQNYTGISPFAAGIICFAAGVDAALPANASTDADKSALYNAFNSTMTDVCNGIFTPFTLHANSSIPMGFSVIGRDLYNAESTKDFDSTSAMVEFYFAAKDNTSRIQQKSQDIRKLVQNFIERCVKKADMQESLLEEVQDREKFKILGELITANIYAIPMGTSSFTAVNFYEEEAPEITIPLDPAKTASENAQAYFAKYNKQKRTHTALMEQMTQNRDELQYLEAVRESLNHSSDGADLAQIREELAAQGFIKKASKTGKKPPREQKPKPLHYISSDGYDIYVGKNNIQNDELTLRFAAQDDIWLHTKSIPGSHVILRAKGGKVSDASLEQAAMLAAYYSKGRTSSLVPVDYCPRKQVSKPRGAKPGMVIYDGHKTAYITPDENAVAEIAKG